VLAAESVSGMWEWWFRKGEVSKDASAVSTCKWVCGGMRSGCLVRLVCGAMPDGQGCPALCRPVHAQALARTVGAWGGVL
jgi:hypothetical protein